MASRDNSGVCIDRTSGGGLVDCPGTLLHRVIGGRFFRAEWGGVLPAGSLVLAGALTDAVPVRSGAVHRAEIRGLGAVEIR